MSFFRALVALQLSMLLVSFSTVNGFKETLAGEGKGVPLPPRRSPPVGARTLGPRLPIAVQGVVFCKPCKYAGKETLQDAKPLAGAIVKMVCENAKSLKSPVVRVAKTDKNGYFFIEPTNRVTSYGAHKRCKVFLALPPAGSKCTNPTHLNWGSSGAHLKPTKPATRINFALYTVGPFAFEPVCSHEPAV